MKRKTLALAINGINIYGDLITTYVGTFDTMYYIWNKGIVIASLEVKNYKIKYHFGSTDTSYFNVVEVLKKW